MALDASQRGMGSGERVVGIDRVIEGDGCPVRCCVAGSAGGGETGRDVIWIGGPCKVFLVAAVATGGQGCVVVVDVALRTGNSGMRAGKGKAVWLKVDPVHPLVVWHIEQSVGKPPFT